MYPSLMPQDTGWVEVIVGCMFSGKTEELIRRLRRAQYARQSIVVFKPNIDDRYSVDSVGSHAGRKVRSIQIQRASEILGQVGDAVVVGIDEAQFLDDELPAVVDHLASMGRRVIIAGLDTDYLGEPFGPIPRLLCTAEYIQKMLAICMVCGNPADRSQRIVRGGEQVLVGETEAYEARCRACWDPDDPISRQETLPYGRNLADEAASSG